MKRILIIGAILSASALGQPAKTADAGAAYAINSAVTFGGNNFLNITSSTDTLSDPIVAEVSGIRPGTFIGFEYKARNGTPATAGYTIYFHSRTCTTPQTSTGCPTQWMTPTYRFFQNGQHFADTMVVSSVPSDTTQFGHYTLIPTGNQMRIRIRGTGATATYAKDLKLLGY